jgi:hypothetical protein
MIHHVTSQIGSTSITIETGKLAKLADGAVTVQHALRGSTPQRIDLATLKATLACYFEPANGGHMIDQAWQPRLPEGMVRAYMVEDRVTGFGVQAVNALHPDAPAAE